MRYFYLYSGIIFLKINFLLVRPAESIVIKEITYLYSGLTMEHRGLACGDCSNSNLNLPRQGQELFHLKSPNHLLSLHPLPEF